MANFTPQEIEEMLQEFFDTVGKRQYIGSRYVPIFGRKGESTINWNNSDAYEPLSIVLYNGDSYTSRKYVPAGIDILDTNYWVVTGRYNAQVEQYRQEVLGFSDRIDDAFEAIDTLRDDTADTYVPFPDASQLPKYGEIGQVLSTLMGGKTKWIDPVTIDAETAAPIIEEWLDDHPEATTTVEDGSITDAKLTQTQLIAAIGKQTLEVLPQYVTLNGDLNTAANFCHSLVQLNAGDKITLRAVGTTGVAMIALQLTETTFKPIVIGVPSLANYTYTTPSDCTIAVSYDANLYWSCFVEPKKQSTVNDLYLNFRTNGFQTDLNAIKANSITMFQNKTPTNWPSQLPVSDAFRYMVITHTEIINGSLFGHQYVLTAKNLNLLAHREISGGTWETWVYAPATFDSKSIAETNNINFDSLNSGIISFISQGTPTQLPALNYGGRNICITTRRSNDFLTDWDSQVIYCETSQVIASRVYYQGWQNWVLKYIHDRVIEIGAGKPYTTIRAGFSAAESIQNCKVIVYAGTYDLTSEFSDVLTNHSGQGNLLCNGNHYIFMPGANVTCNVDVSNTWAYSNFEPFRVNQTDFILEGLHMVGKNTRYNVHDECSGNGTYKHEYINCFMEHTDENAIAYYPQCIGGGLGEHGYINIVGGRYKSSALYVQQHYQTTDDMQMPITYHNGNNANAYGTICISGVYLADKGYLRFGSYGESTLLTPVEVSNCRMYKPPYMMQEQFDPDEPTNFELIAFNNEIVTP